MSEEIVKITGISSKAETNAASGINKTDFDTFIKNYEKKHQAMMSLVATTANTSSNIYKKLLTTVNEIKDNQITSKVFDEFYTMFDIYTSDVIRYHNATLKELKETYTLKDLWSSDNVNVMTSLSKHMINTYDTLFELSYNELEFNDKMLKYMVSFDTTLKNILDKKDPSVVQSNNLKSGKQINTGIDNSVKLNYTGNIDVRSIKELLESDAIFNPVKITLIKKSFNSIATVIANGLQKIRLVLMPNDMGNGKFDDPIKTIEGANEIIKSITSIASLGSTTYTSNSSKSIFGNTIFSINKDMQLISQANTSKLVKFINDVTNSILYAYEQISRISPNKKTIDVLNSITSLFNALTDIITPQNKEKSFNLFGKDIIKISRTNNLDKDLNKFKNNFESIGNVIVSLFDKLNKLKINKNKVTTFITIIDDLLSTITRNEITPKKASSLTILAFGITVLGKSLNLYGKSNKAIQKGTELLISTIDDLSTKLGTNKIKRMTNSLKVLSSGIATLGLSIVAFAVVSPIAIICAGTLMLFSKSINATVGSAKTTKGIALFTASLAMLGLSIWAFSEVVTGGCLLSVVGGLAMLAGAIWLFAGGGSKFLGISTKGAPPYKMIGYIAVGLATLGLTIWAWQELGITSEGMMKVTLGIAMLAGATWLFNKVSATAPKNMSLVALGIAALGGSLWVWDKINPSNELILTTLFAISGIAIVSRLFAGVKITSVVSMLGVAAGVAAIGLSLKLFNDVSFETVGVTAATLGVLGVASLLLSNPLVLAGAASMIALGIGLLGISGGMYVISKTEITTDKATEFAKSLGIITLGMAVLAVPAVIASVTSVLLLPVVAASLGIAGVFGLISKINIKTDKIEIYGEATKKLVNVYDELGLIKVTKAAAKAVLIIPLTASALSTAVLIRLISSLEIDKKRIEENGEAMGWFLQKMVDVFSNVEGKISSVKKGIKGVAGLANTIKSLADAVLTVSKMEYPENKIVDGKIVPVSIRKLTDADFENVGNGIGKMLDSLIDPLIKIGSSQETYKLGKYTITNPFGSGNKVKKGINAIKGIGEIFTPLADVIKAITGTGALNKDNQDAATKIEDIIGSLLTSLSNSLKDLASVEVEDADDIKDTINAISSIFKPIGELITSISNTGILSDENKDGSTKLTNVLTGVSDTIKSTFEKLSAVNKSENISNVTKGLNAIFTSIAEIDTTGLKSFREEIDKIYEKLKDVIPWNTFRINLQNYEVSSGKLVKHINGIELEKAIVLSNIVKNLKDADDNGNIELLIEQIKELIGQMVDNQQRFQDIQTTANENITNLTNNISNTNNSNPVAKNEIKETQSNELSGILAELRNIYKKLNSKIIVAQSPSDIWKVKSITSGGSL